MVSPPPSRRLLISLGIGLALGAAIWALSPAITGAAEPWDADQPYLLVSLLLAGIVGQFAYPGNIWAMVGGLFAGQLFFMVTFLGVGPLILVGVGVLVVYSIAALFGAYVGLRLRRHFLNLPPSG